MAKILIAYYTWSGNTGKIAEMIAKETGGVLFAMEPLAPYSGDYQAAVAQAKKEISEGFKPELLKTTAPEAFDMVFIGSPKWWSTIAPPVAPFLSEKGLAGKTVVPFCTHGGGGRARLFTDIKTLCPDADVPEGFEVYGAGNGSTAKAVGKWVKQLMP